MVRVNDYQDLFSQASTQLNFLLLTQRNMILVMAFSLTFLGFSTTFRSRIMIRLIIFSFLIYSLLLGIISTIDYREYMEKTRDEITRQNFDDGLDLLDNWANWVNFTYALLALNCLIILFYIFYEIDHHYSTRERPSRFTWVTLRGGWETDDSGRGSSSSGRGSSPRVASSRGSSSSRRSIPSRKVMKRS